MRRACKVASSGVASKRLITSEKKLVLLAATRTSSPWSEERFCRLTGTADLTLLLRVSEGNISKMQQG